MPEVSVEKNLSSSGLVSTNSDITFDNGVSLVTRFSDLFSAIQQTKSNFSSDITTQFSQLAASDTSQYTTLNSALSAAQSQYTQQITAYQTDLQNQIFQQYQDGYRSGYSSGYAAGNSRGDQAGFTAGGNDGRSAGFQAGMAQIETWRVDGRNIALGYGTLFAEAQLYIQGGYTGTRITTSLFSAQLFPGNPPPPPPEEPAP